MRTCVLAFVLLLSFPLAAQQAVTPGYFRFPAITSDSILFTAEGDLWRVPAAGGEAIGAPVYGSRCAVPDGKGPQHG